MKRSPETWYVYAGSQPAPAPARSSLRARSLPSCTPPSLLGHRGIHPTCPHPKPPFTLLLQTLLNRPVIPAMLLRRSSSQATDHPMLFDPYYRQYHGPGINAGPHLAHSSVQAPRHIPPYPTSSDPAYTWQGDGGGNALRRGGFEYGRPSISMRAVSSSLHPILQVVLYYLRRYWCHPSSRRRHFLFLVCYATVTDMCLLNHSRGETRYHWVFILNRDVVGSEICCVWGMNAREKY